MKTGLIHPPSAIVLLVTLHSMLTCSDSLRIPDTFSNRVFQMRTRCSCPKQNFQKTRHTVPSCNIDVENPWFFIGAGSTNKGFSTSMLVSSRVCFLHFIVYMKRLFWCLADLLQHWNFERWDRSVSSERTISTRQVPRTAVFFIWETRWTRKRCRCLLGVPRFWCWMRYPSSISGMSNHLRTRPFLPFFLDPMLDFVGKPFGE